MRKRISVRNQLRLPFIEDDPAYRRRANYDAIMANIRERYPMTEHEKRDLPTGCRLARFVDLEECDHCNFGPYDHIVGNHYPKLCLKDLARLGLWKPDDDEGV